MPLDIEVKGDPTALRATARWLMTVAAQTDRTVADIHRARVDSQDDWTGRSADGFRTVLAGTRPGAEALLADLEGAAKALNRYADDLAGCKAEMGRAREIAARAGLATTATTIAEPGTPPNPPAGGPQGNLLSPGARVPRPAGPYSAEYHRQFSAYEQAYDAYLAKAKAYLQAAQIVVSCREKESTAQKLHIKFWKSLDTNKYFHITNFGVGLAGAVSPRLSAFRHAAQEADRAAKSFLRHAGLLQHNPNFAGKNFDLSRYGAIAGATEAQHTADDLHLGMMKTQLSRALDSSLGRALLDPTYAGNWTGRVPIAGWVVTGVSVTLAVKGGQHPVHATTSGIGGTLAGAGATAALIGAGTPGGWAVAGGVLVGAGTGFVIDQWGDDVVDGVEDTYTGVRDGVTRMAWPRP
ncbi:hypothetical protein DPM19_29565 [Actinomadura craniellae]|uniref:Uncharacterized protein n=1 Tax=Actinomadura craniellae TaxID=2231787 RepID=A0A365GXB0_9ACTN|nr:hypothetical protein [Actinomadura craniellae]RAY11460.1 hypothetical protein DPM19_29565 [Actinomadura craniellae]